MKDLAMLGIQGSGRTSPLFSSSKSGPDSSQSTTDNVSQSSPVPLRNPAQTLPKTLQNSPVLLHDVLPSVGQSWQWFTTSSSLQFYINTLQESHDFGVCFLDQDGSRCCCIMRARGTKRSYSLPALHYWATQDTTSTYEFPDAGCKAMFWWCLPPSLSTDPDPALLDTVEELHRRYDTARLLINTFKTRVMNAQMVQEELNIAYKRHLLDLPLREKHTGRFSIDAMNTVLLLSELAEASKMFSEARRWNYEFVSRRTRRLGRTSEHTCQARYKLSSLLLLVGEYDDARDVSRENLQCLRDMRPTSSLVVRQNIQSCMISMKRRRLDQAMEVLPHLWTAERWHENDLRTRDQALSVLIEATLFRHQFVEAEGWVRKRIKLFDRQLQDMKSGFGDNKHRGDAYI
jgi:hypothetical protein